MSGHTEITELARAAVEAATRAPSVHNTQPWSFVLSGAEIGLVADTERVLRTADPAGRQLLISCGSALFTLRTALRALGVVPQTRVLPDPDRPSLLATVRLAERAEPDEHTLLLRAEIGRRHTHRGDFGEPPLPRAFEDALCREVSAEGARLLPIGSGQAVRAIAALTTAAEETQEGSREFTLELLRWGRTTASARRDGVPMETGPREPVRAEPAFAQRDYSAGRFRERPAVPVAASSPASPGRLALLVTAGDTREEWIAAGQGLQRALLFASAYGVSAAFHTQALEMEHLREFIADHFCQGAHPQMIIRFGVAPGSATSARRALHEVFEDRT